MNKIHRIAGCKQPCIGCVQGFTLVELSIVLVILGLLVGGVLAGQNLIRAAELRSVTTEFTNYQTAVMTFKEKYFAIPGDIDNATAFWGVNASCSSGGVGTGTQTCDGDKNNTINAISGVAYEQFYFWQHLSNAGLIGDTYSGQSTAFYLCDVGVNCPKSKVSNAIWFATSHYVSGNAGTNGWWWNNASTENLFLGAYNGGVAYPFSPIMTPAEAWAIDTKIDNGKPASGIVGSAGGPGIYDSSCAVNATTGAALTNAEGSQAASDNAAYDLARDELLCAFRFRLKS